MLKNKVTEILSAMSPEELKRFGEFLSSAYFNKNTNLQKLFSELKKHYPTFSDKKLTNEYLYKKAVTPKGFNQQIMRNLNTGLVKLAKEFLAVEYFSDNESEKSLAVLYKLSEKKLTSAFRSDLKELESRLLSRKDATQSILLDLYRMEMQRLDFLIQTDQQEEAADYILTQSHYIIHHFIVHLANAQNNIRINEDTFNKKFDVNLVREVIKNTDLGKIVEYMSKNKFEFSSLVNIHYYKMMCSLFPEKEEYYYKLKSFLTENIPYINKMEMYSIITAIEVYCTTKISKGETKFYNELFDVYKLAVNYGTFVKGAPPQITAIKFRNIYICALRVGEIDWAENFVATHQNFLSDEGKILSELAYAQFDIQKGNYDKAMERLNEINTDLYYVKKDIRRFMIQIHYERDHLESALATLGSFRQYINNNTRLIPGAKDNYIKFINVMTNLVKIKSSHDRKKLKSLKERVETDSLPSREWILEKISELE